MFTYLRKLYRPEYSLDALATLYGARMLHPLQRYGGALASMTARNAATAYRRGLRDQPSMPSPSANTAATPGSGTSLAGGACRTNDRLSA